MPGTLQHSPADVLAYLLAYYGMGSNPTDTNLIWPVYVDNEPDTSGIPDNCVTVYNSISRQQGRTQVDREIQEMHGIQVRIRSSVSREGYAKARQLAIFLDESVYQNIVRYESAVYCVHSFTRTSDITPLGKEAQVSTKRSVHTFNGLLVITEKGLGTGTYF